MNYLQKFEFPLSRNGQTLGIIKWQFGDDNKDVARLDGDALAVDALECAIAQGIREQWEGHYPRPLRVIVNNPVNSMYEMITVLEYAGFDMPDVLYAYTATAQRKLRQDIEYDEDDEWGGQIRY